MSKFFDQAKLEIERHARANTEMGDEEFTESLF